MEYRHIDISAADNAYRLFAFYRNLVVHYGCNARGSRSFGNDLFLFEQVEYRAAYLVFGDGNDTVNIFAAYIVCKRARFFYGYSVGNCRYIRQNFTLVCFKTAYHACGTGSLNTVNLDIGIERFYCKCNTADKSAAADRHHYRLDIGQLVEKFKSYRALSGNDILVVERMYERISFLFFQLYCPLVRIVIHSRHETYLRAIAACCLNLAHGSAFGQADERLYSVRRSTQCHALRMVSCRAGNDTFSLFLVRKL